MRSSPCSRLRRAASLVALCLCASFAPAGAVIIDSGDGGGNLDPPADFPYWKNVDQRFGGTSVIYLGRGWVLTARHVGAGIVVFDSQRYSPEPDTLTYFGSPEQPADLLLFRLSKRAPWPDLPMLELAARRPQPGEPVLMIGNGRNRDARRRDRGPGGQALTGWSWGATAAKRWGTNRVVQAGGSIEHNGTSTRAFSTRFDSLYDGGFTEHEAQAAEGDSGGAVFMRRDPGDAHSAWVLAGVMFTVNHPLGGSVAAAYYGDLTHAVDLSAYRTEILAKLRPECVVLADDGPVERRDAPADCGWTDEAVSDEATAAKREDALDMDVEILRSAASSRGGSLLKDDMLLRDDARHDEPVQREGAPLSAAEAPPGDGGSAEGLLVRATRVGAVLVVAACLAAALVTLASRRRR